MHKIAVISDTHGLIRDQVRERLSGCEAILHGGDINRQAILDELAEIAPVYAVRGNNDKEWAEQLPETLSLELFGLRIFMVHNKKYLSLIHIYSAPPIRNVPKPSMGILMSLFKGIVFIIIPPLIHI